MTEPLVIQRILAATCEEVFAAWTNPASIQAWMCPGPGVTSTVVEMDLQIDGVLRIDMKGDWGVSGHTGRYREITPPSRLSFTWCSANTQNRDTLVTIELTPHPDGAQLTLTHTDLPHTQSWSDHQGGWNHILDSLKAEIVRG